MKKNPVSPADAAELRRRAEERLKKRKGGQVGKGATPLLVEDTQRLIQELQIHQIELELQNEELKTSRAEVEAGLALYAELYDFAPVSYFTLGRDGTIRRVNLTGARVLDMERGRLAGRRFAHFVSDEDRPAFNAFLKKVFASREKETCEAALRKEKKGPPSPERSGSRRFGEMSQSIVHMEAVASGDGQECRVVLADITGRKQAEAALQQAHDELEQRVVARTEELRQANAGLRADIIERKRGEEALQESEEKYRSLAVSVDSMYLVDRDCTYLFMNEGHRNRFGLPLEEIIGRRYGEFHSEEDTKEFADCIREVCETGKPSIKEHRSERDRMYFLRTFTPIMGRSPVGEISKVVIVSKDITKRKQAEKDIIETVQQLHETRDMLIQFEKEAAVGRLAVGVAHELLNPVSIISSRLQFMEDETLTDQVREGVRICREQLQRIAKISQDLHQSSAIQPRLHVSGDLRDMIELSLKMTESRIREDQVCVVYHPPPAIIPVKMASDRISKVMVHLILNACDALLNTDQKRLIITVQYPIATDKPSSVLLIVADNGCGVSEGDMNRIFDPFFTTKDPGKGTGLGLSVSKGIIQEHGGTIHMENNDMGGASFIVELPFDHP